MRKLKAEEENFFDVPVLDCLDVSSSVSKT